MAPENASTPQHKILVVDDEPPILEIIQTILTSEGYQVDTAKDGLEALSLLANKRYDLVLSDVMLPEMGGLELLQKISLLYPQITTVMLTGYANIKDAVVAIKLGAFDYIAKPVYPEALILTIARALKFKSLREAAEELEWTLKGAEALGLQILELSPEVEEFRLLDQLRQEAPGIDDRAALSQLFLARAQELSQASRGSVFLYDHQGTDLRCLALSSNQPEHLSQTTVSGGEGVMGYVIHHGRPLLVMDVLMEPRFYQPKISQRYASNSFMVVPISWEKIWGVINLADRSDLQPFTPRDLLLIWLLARIFAEALQSLERREKDRSLNRALRKTQRELEEVKEYFDRFCSSVSMGMAMLDPELRINSVNRAFADMCGQEDQALIGKNLLAVLKLSSPGDEKKLQQCCERILLGEPSVSCGQLNLITPAQGNTYMDVRLTAVNSPAGGIQVLALFEDVTEISRMQQKANFYEHLAIMGKLTACVVHELNNPLDGVQRYLSLALRKKDEPGEVERYLSEAQKGLTKMSQAIKSMLDITNPKRPLKAQDSLTNQIQEAIKILLFQANDQNVEISLAVPPIFEEILFGSDLYTVCVNLIKNALHAMPNGGRLDIIGSEAHQGLQVQFRDSGSGIAPEHLEGIFKPFFTTKTQGQGLGLGLPICQKILEKYRGRLLVDSVLGQGSTFTMELPWPSSAGQVNYKDLSGDKNGEV